jgi:two-component system sensor histidine kinase YesM
MLRKPLPFQYRLILVIILTVLLPSVLLNGVTFSIVKKQMLTDATTWLTGITKNSGETMDSYINLINGVTKNPEFDRTLMNIFDRHRFNTEGKYAYSVEEISQINGWLTMLTQMDNNIVAVNFLDESGNSFHLGKIITVDDSEWLQKTESLKGASAVWSPVKTEDGTIVFSVSRKIISPITFHNIAAIQIFFKLDFLTLKQNEVFLKEGDFVILDKDNSVVFRQSERHAGSGQLWDAPNQVTATFDSVLTGWKLVGAVPKDILFQSINRIQRWVYLINVVFIFITMCIVFLISFQLTNPLRKLSKLMLDAVKKNFNIEIISIKRHDEIGHISSSFNKMINRIHSLIEDVTETERKRKRSDIAALQSQINPHFLYNTLSAIAMQAEMEGCYKVSDMASQLGRFLRYTIGYDQEWVKLSQECDHLGIYFRVMQFRYPLIEFELYLDENVKDWLVIRLILQPLVENAIIHGIVPKGTSGIVKVTIVDASGPNGGELLTIQVEDTGIGMKQETMTALRSYLQGSIIDHKSNFGIGLKNVYDRISLSYEDRFKFDMISEEGIGSQIHIELPRRRTNENHGG